MMSRTQPRLPGAIPWPPERVEHYRNQGIWLGETLSEWFEARVKAFAEHTAIVDGERRVSYAQLASRVNRLALGLHELGLRDLDRVVVQLPNGLELVEVLFALARLGAVPVLALPAHRLVELEAITQRSGAVALVMAGRHGAIDLCPIATAVNARCPQVRWVLWHGPAAADSGFHALEDLYANESDARRGSEPSFEACRVLKTPLHTAGDVLLLQLSGGSTGIPKLIARTHDDYLYSVRQSAEVCRLNSETRFLAVLPMTHNFTLSSPGILGVLHTGGTVVSCPHPSAEVVFDLMQREAITLAAAVPSLVAAWLESARGCLGTRRFDRLTLQVGGAKLEQSLALATLKTLGCKLQQVFGMAEGLVNYTREDDSIELVTTTQGRPMSPLDEVRIVDLEHSRQEVTPGSPGELQTRGPYTICGYYADASASAASFTDDGFYRTGDIVRQLASGHLVVEGRIGERILRGGEKIAPLEIEAHLLSHPAVREAAVLGFPDALLGQKQLACVVLRDATASLDAVVIRRYLREQGLAEFKLPDRVHFLSELPRTPVGKTDKNVLLERCGARAP